MREHLEGLGNPLKLVGTDAQLGPLQDVVAAMPGGTITLDTSGSPIRLDGDTLTIRGGCDTTWPIAGLGKAAVTLASATLTVTTAGATTATIAAVLPITPNVGPTVSIAPLAGQTGAWEISLTADAPRVTPADLILLALGAGTLPFSVPSGLDVFDEAATIDPSAFAIRFAPHNDAATSSLVFRGTVQTGSWHLIPGIVDFTGLDVLAMISSSAWSITLVGHFAIGDVAMTLGIHAGSGPIWTATLLPEGNRAFPGIVEFADWVSGGSSLGRQTRDGLQGLKLNNVLNVSPTAVRLNVDTVAAKVDSLQIEGLARVLGLELALVLTLPAITLSGSLTEPDTRVVAMLSACELPTGGVPDTLAVAAADFSADVPNATYSAHLVVTGEWPVGPVQLNQVGATLSYATGTLSGGFNAQVGIAGAVVELSADYDGTGWVFTGRTLPGTPATIGALIADLSTKFGIGTVPAALKSLTLTELHVTYATATAAFAFACTCTMNVNDTPVTLVATIDVAKTRPKDEADSATTVGTRGFSAKFGGTITLNTLRFDLVFDLADDKSDILVADYVPVGDAEPAELKSLVAAVSATLADNVPTGVTLDLQEVKFCLYRSTRTRWAFGLRLGTSIDLSKLPVIGSKLPADLALGLNDLQALYASDEFTADQVKAVNKVLPDKITKLPDTLAAGISLQGKLTVGDTSLDIGTGVKPAQSDRPLDAELAVRPVADTPATSTQPITWVDLNRQIGIFTFRRVGVGYADNTLLFSLDATVGLGPVTFSLVGLTVGSPLDHFDPTFTLDGLSLSFDRPPISLGGAFQRVSQTQNGHTFDAYYGEVMVQIPKFGLTAVGGWAPDADPAMFFVYLAINAPIGGPPFLQITGLSGGFGINSRLVLPDIDHVATYALMPGPDSPKQPGNPADVLSEVVPRLQSTFEVQGGQYWAAAGITASSFQMITVRAVVSVGFGVDVQIGVVGSGSITLPAGDPSPVAYIEIDVVASYTPATGVLAIDGKLSPASYLFGGFVKLTGGFALRAWFKNTTEGDSAGDFVVTIGGYHPAFAKPDNYPAVPRLGLAFSLGPIKVVGRGYIALTPGAFMAGLEIAATFTSGSVSAWFDAGLDFLIAWAPFHYSAHAWVAIGCKVDLGLFSIRVQIGADLQIWGPPFGGRATVDLDVVSFTIAFGAPARPPAPVGWATMAADFLPKPKSAPALAAGAGVLADASAPVAANDVTGLVSAAAVEGLISTTTPGLDWIVNGNTFRISVRSTVPANHPRLGTGTDAAARLPNRPGVYARQVVAAITAAGPNETGLTETRSAQTRSTQTRLGAAGDTPADLLPGDLRLALDAETVTYSAREVWQPDLNIAPMKQRHVNSYLTVSLRRRDTDGDGWSTYVTNLTVLPQLTGANAALWGDGSAATDVNGERLVAGALVGLDLAPVPRHPGAVNAVALLELIFAEGVSTGFVYQPLAPPSAYTAHGTVSADRSALDIVIGGAHAADLPNHDYRMSALTEPWVEQQRADVLDALAPLGFHTPTSSEVSVAEFATGQLSDWPQVGLIGQPR